MIERGPANPTLPRCPSHTPNRFLQRHFREQLIDRNPNIPPHGITSLLRAHAEINSEPLDERTKAAMLLLMLIGGIDTTWTAIGASLWHLAKTPTTRTAPAEPELIPTAVEEFLRAYSPVTMAREVTKETYRRLPGQAGQHRAVSFPAANRDPAMFPDADPW